MLLELTEQELEVLKRGLIKEKTYWEDNETASNSLKETKFALCNSAWAKMDRAGQRENDILIEPKDLAYIVSVAKNEYGHLRADLHISNKRVEQNDFRFICLTSAVISWLNSKGLLKRLVKFDFTDNSSEFEETEE